MRSWLLVLAACGSRSAPTLTVKGIEVTLPAGVDPATVQVVVEPTLPKELERYTLASEHYTITAVVTLATPTALPSPVRLAIPVAGCAADQAFAISFDKAPVQLPISSSHEHWQLSLVKPGTVLVGCPKVGVQMLGSPAMVFNGGPQILGDKDCAGWIANQSVAVKAIAADPKRFSIGEDGALHVDAKLEAKPSQGELARADAVLQAGGGDAANLAVVYGSLLAAQGAPVRLAGGGMRIDDGAKHSEGVAMWAEAIVGGKPMFVDVLDPVHVKLVPLPEAQAKFHLQPFRTCAKYPANVTPNWQQWEAAAEPAPQTPPPLEPASDENLLERRRVLDKGCAHGANKDACRDRGIVDDQIKQRLEALLVQHREAEAKCKVGHDPGACTARDQLAERGKALKAQLGAKP